MTKAKRITVIQGHPDPKGGHYCHALAEAYAGAALAAGHEVRTIEVARVPFPLLHNAKQFEKGKVPPAIGHAQRTIHWADHIVLFFPLWLGTMPALLKGFFEQVFRPGFALDAEEGHVPRQLLKGRSAHVVVTMGMPGFLYRWFYRAHGLRGLERNILGFSGISPIRDTLVGLAGARDPRHRRRWLETMADLGRQAA